MFLNKLLRIVKFPPTKCIRYKQSVQLVQKNSFKSPTNIFYKEKTSFQRFIVLWNEDMTNFRLKEHKINNSFKV